MKEGRDKLYIVGQDLSYYKPWAPIFSLTDHRDEAKVALFTGGSDVTPELYGAVNRGWSGNDWPRDEREREEFLWFKEHGVPMIGICRGSQFLTVMNGGKLYQHVAGHALGGSTHSIITENGKELLMTSTHHQMMRPRGNYKLIAWAPKIGDLYIPEDKPEKPELPVDPEIVFYPETRCLAIQGHPEYLPTTHETNEYCRKLAQDLLLD